MARKRNKRAVLPVSLGPELYERMKLAADYERERLKIDTFGPAALARQAILIRVEEIEKGQVVAA